MQPLKPFICFQHGLTEECKDAYREVQGEIEMIGDRHNEVLEKVKTFKSQKMHSRHDNEAERDEYEDYELLMDFCEYGK